MNTDMRVALLSINVGNYNTFLIRNTRVWSRWYLELRSLALESKVLSIDSSLSPSEKASAIRYRILPEPKMPKEQI